MPSITLPATLEQLETVNQFLAQHVSADYEPLLPHVELAAEELLVNVFSYAYPKGNGTAEVTCSEAFLDEIPYFCLSIRDWGPPFNPFSEAPEPDLTLALEERPVGGLGIHLVKNITAHRIYSRVDDANLIKLFFALSDENPSEAV